MIAVPRSFFLTTIVLGFSIISFSVASSTDVGDVRDIKSRQIDKFSNLLTEFMATNKLTWDGMDVMYEVLSGRVPITVKTLKISDKVSLSLKDNPEERNALIVDGKTWLGKLQSEPEVVFTDGHTVYTTTTKLPDISKLLVVSFSPDQVRYIDFSNNSGGRAVRGDAPL